MTWWRRHPFAALWRRGSAVRNVQTSLGGSLIPAAIGILATLILSRTPHQSAAAAVLLVWTVVGYLSITDFGLSRSASRLISDGHDAPARVVASLWRASLGVGAAMAVIVAVVMAFVARNIVASEHYFLWLLVVVPPIASLQFPLIGVLEAMGSFRRLAAQRIGNALGTYAGPAVLVVADGSLVWAGVVMVVVYRFGALLWLWRSTGISFSDVVDAFRGRQGVAARNASVRRVAPWVAASSLIGSFYLYADRGLLAASEPRIDVWVTYVAISELILKTYLIPTATLSVAFPWLIANLQRRRELIGRFFTLWAPIGTVVSATAGAALAWLGAPVALRWLGAAQDVMKPMAVVLMVGVAATLVNWSSQAYVAVLQAIDRQRTVVAIQSALILPFVAAAILAMTKFGVIGLSCVWAIRIVVMWVLLVLRTRAALRSGVTQDLRQGMENG